MIESRNFMQITSGWKYVGGSQTIELHKVPKKKALTVERIKKIYDHGIKTETSIYNKRTFTLVNLSFRGFLRYSEASNIRRSDIDFQLLYMKIFFEIYWVYWNVYRIVSSTDVTKVS